MKFFFIFIYFIGIFSFSISHNILKSTSILKYRGGKIDERNSYAFYPLKSDRTTSFEGSDSRFVLGKDRQLFHAVIDLKWVFSRLTDKKGWSLWFSSLGRQLKKTFYPPYAQALSYYDDALAIGNLIYKENEHASIKIWSSNLSEALKNSQLNNIPILFYCHEDFTDMMTTLSTIKTNQMLSNSEIGDFLNENFLFLTCQENNPYINKIKKRYKIINSHSPYFVILFPNNSFYIFESNSSKDSLAKDFLSWINNVMKKNSESLANTEEHVNEDAVIDTTDIDSSFSSLEDFSSIPKFSLNENIGEEIVHADTYHTNNNESIDINFSSFDS